MRNAHCDPTHHVSFHLGSDFIWDGASGNFGDDPEGITEFFDERDDRKIWQKCYDWYKEKYGEEPPKRKSKPKDQNLMRLCISRNDFASVIHPIYWGYQTIRKPVVDETIGKIMN